MIVSIEKEITQVTLQDKKGTFFTCVKENDFIAVKTHKKNILGQVKVLQEDGMIIQDKATPHFILYKEIESCGYSKSVAPNFSCFFDEVTDRLIKTGKIRKQENLDAFLHGYIKGVCAQQRFNWPLLETGMVRSLKKRYAMKMCKPFYFLLENDDYLIVMAEEIGVAIDLFKKRKRNTKWKSVVNESIWKRQYCRIDKEPVEIIT